MKNKYKWINSTHFDGVTTKTFEISVVYVVEGKRKLFSKKSYSRNNVQSYKLCNISIYN